MTKTLTKKQRAEAIAWLEQDPVNWAELHFYIEDRIDPITGEELGPGPIVLADHQKRIIRAALERDADGKFRWTTVVYSCPKKAENPGSRPWSLAGSLPSSAPTPRYIAVLTTASSRKTAYSAPSRSALRSTRSWGGATRAAKSRCQMVRSLRPFQ